MSTLRNLWFRWKALRLPWRRRFLVGRDLVGNTYWEMKSSGGGRMRRMAEGHGKMHHSDVQISPQWHQWLRHTRFDAPTIEEQQMDVTRQIQLKQNARLADQRWENKRQYIEKPAAPYQQQSAQRMTMGGNPEVGEGQETIKGGDAPKTEPAHKEGVRNAVADPLEQVKGKGADGKPDPWEQERRKQSERASNPGGTWQPEAWTPPPRRR